MLGEKRVGFVFFVFLFSFMGNVFSVQAQSSALAEEEVVDVFIKVKGAFSQKQEAKCAVKAFKVFDRKSVPLRTRKAQRVVDDVKDLKSPLHLPFGLYDVLLSCPVRGGDVRTSARIKVKKTQKKKRVHEIVLSPSRALIEVYDGGNTLTKTVVFFDKNGREVQRGPAQVLLNVPAEKLTIAVLVDDKKLRRKGFRLMGSLRLNVKKQRRNVGRIDVSPGFLEVKVKNNARAASALIAVRATADAERLLEFSAGEKVELPAGLYDIVTQLDEAHDVFEKITRKVRIRPSKTTKVLVQHQTGKVRVLVQAKGALFGYLKAVPAPLHVKTELFLGAARASFNEVDVQEELVLSAGDYRVRVTLVGQKLDDGEDVFAESRFQVRAKRVQKVMLLFSQKELKVRTLVGETPISTWVVLREAQSNRLLSKKKSNAQGEVLFRVRPTVLRVSADLKQGLDLYQAEERIKLQKTNTTEVKLLFDVGQALVQVYDGDMAVRAKIYFYLNGASKALKKARAGQAVFLKPGRYDLVVERKGKRWVFPAVSINGKRRVERKLTLNDAALEKNDDDEDIGINDEGDVLLPEGQ